MDKVRPDYHNWTRDEIQYIRDHYGRQRVADIADHLHMTNNAVRKQARRLNIVIRKSEDSIESLRYVRDITEFTGKTASSRTIRPSYKLERTMYEVRLECTHKAWVTNKRQPRAICHTCKTHGGGFDQARVDLITRLKELREMIQSCRDWLKNHTKPIVEKDLVRAIAAREIIERSQKRIETLTALNERRLKRIEMNN